ncbi:hypothetical protein ACCO45_004147 [Purpureocillium lilacinum]|uniref:Uncharacterized protein n=1 Tax=Purpureocillium lilacinum TaxID=33203 RepID=A0ACC4E4E9_PURLI
MTTTTTTGEGDKEEEEEEQRGDDDSGDGPSGAGEWARTHARRAGGRALSFKFPTKRHAYGGVSVVVVGRGAGPL